MIRISRRTHDIVTISLLVVVLGLACAFAQDDTAVDPPAPTEPVAEATPEESEAIESEDDVLPRPNREWLDGMIEDARSGGRNDALAILSLGDAEIYCDDAAEALIEQLRVATDDTHVTLQLLSLGRLADRSPKAAGALCAFLREINVDASERDTYLVGDTLKAIAVAGPAASAAWEDILEIAQTTEDEEVYREALFALGELGVWTPEVEAFLLATVQGDAPRAAIMSLSKIGFGEDTREVLTEIVEAWVQSDRYPDAPTGPEYRAMEALAYNGEFDAMYPHLMEIGFMGSDDLETAVFVTLTGLGPIASPMVEELEVMALDRELLAEGELADSGVSLEVTRAMVLRWSIGAPVDNAFADGLLDLLEAGDVDTELHVSSLAICALLGNSLESNPSIYARAAEMTQSDDPGVQCNGLLIMAYGASTPYNLGVYYRERQRITPAFRLPVGGIRSGWNPHRALPHFMRVIQETDDAGNWDLAGRTILAMAPLTPDEIEVLRELALAEEDEERRVLLAGLVEYCEWALANP
jgi:hypothetical protein